MQWLELTIKTRSDGLSLLEDHLTALGYDSFQVDDEREFHDFLEETRPFWNYVDDGLMQSMSGKSQVRLYLANDPSAPEAINRLRSALAELRAAFPDAPLGSLDIDVSTLEEADWETGWKQYYQPIAIGSRLLVVPQWLNPPNPENRLCIRLDPGMMFGTGDHASTRLCLQALEQIIRGGERVLDLGTGSGILSIAALQLGAGSALGVDIDPKGADIARENAGYNGFAAPRFAAATANVLELSPEQPYDVVLANIVADVILPLAPRLVRYLRPGGAFLCSGILHERVPEIIQALRQAGIGRIRTEEADGWAACLGVMEAKD